jgi:hypothetical protein
MENITVFLTHQHISEIIFEKWTGPIWALTGTK